MLGEIVWDKVFKNGPSKICERHPLKNFTWCILQHLVSFVLLKYGVLKSQPPMPTPPSTSPLKLCIRSSVILPIRVNSLKKNIVFISWPTKAPWKIVLEKNGGHKKALNLEKPENWVYQINSRYWKNHRKVCSSLTLTL